MYCGDCKQECEIRVEDEGIGYTEFWGVGSIDVHLVIYSQCCEATVFEDAELTKEVTEIEHYYGPT